MPLILNTLFETGFETSDGAADASAGNVASPPPGMTFTSGTGNQTITREQAFEGVQSLRLNSSGAVDFAGVNLTTAKADLVLVAYVYPTATAQNILWARGDAASWSAMTRGYGLDVEMTGGTTGWKLSKKTGGSYTTVTTPIGSPTAQWYREEFTPYGTMIGFNVQRVSDGYWLQPGGTFAATKPASFAQSLTDTDFASGQYAGVADFSGVSYVDSLTISEITRTSSPAVGPDAVTLAPGETADFVASGFTGAAATWSLREGATAGSLSNATGTGVTFTASATPGTYHLDATGVSNTGETATATITVTVAASPLAAGTATAGSVTSTTAAATATDATGGTPPYTYQWYRSTVSGQVGTAVTGQTTRTLADTGLTASTDYYYTLRYTDAASAHVDSNQIHVTTSAAPGSGGSSGSVVVQFVSLPLAVTSVNPTHLRTGDTGPSRLVQLADAQGRPVPVPSGATVTYHLRWRNNPGVIQAQGFTPPATLSGAVTIVAAMLGLVRYDFTAGLPAAGTYDEEWVVDATGVGGQRTTFPGDGYGTVVITDELV